MQLVWEQYWFKKGDFETSPLIEKETSLDTEESKKLYCDICKYPVTDLNQAISINDAHTHTFTNPSGFVYTINCFQLAPGCEPIGQSTNEFTWFSGYEWQIALCISCKEQLGWLFTNSSQFYALISDRLTHDP